ncbi:MAG: RNA pseudouridine synthase [Pseudomonadales bacterium]|nr:RNA pseudouridine synthase [Pseudomonadales bacterium]MCP5184662.1 RNA pseudouridine synthase [Pseudomonadales bacterium]
MTPAPQPRVLWEDDNLLVLDKPHGISLLADRSGDTDLWSMLTAERKLYLVHRLDKGTSGVLMFAKSQAVQRELTKCFAARKVRKYYIARVVGVPAGGSTVAIDLPLRKGRKSRYRVAGARETIRLGQGTWHLSEAAMEGVDAFTRIRLLSHRNGFATMLAAPRTGRTHQLRVHLAWIGYPIMGDHLYGNPSDPRQQADRLYLHCHRLVVPGIGGFTARVPWP